MGGYGSGIHPPIDVEGLSLKLLAWAELPDSINLNKFCAINKLRPSTLYDLSKKNTEFAGTYELVKAFLGARREEMLNSEKLHVKAYDLNATNYDYFLAQDKKEQAAYQASLIADAEGKKQNITINLTDFSKQSGNECQK